MSNVIYFDFVEHGMAPASDCVALVECVKAAIEEFGPLNFALTLTDHQPEVIALAA